MFRAPAWTPRDSHVLDDDWSDHHPSPVHPSYNDPSPASNWLSPLTAGDDVDMLFDYSKPNAFCSLLDDPTTQHEQLSMLERWRTPALGGKSKSNALSRQATLTDIVIAGEWEEKIVRRYQRKRGLQNLSLREVKREMPPIEFDPAFADSDTEDEEPVFDVSLIHDPPMRVRTPRLPPSISIPAPAQFVKSAPLSPLTPISEPHSGSSLPPPSVSPAPVLAPVELPPTPVSAVGAAPAYAQVGSPVVKEEVAETAPSMDRASPAPKRPVFEDDRHPELAVDADDVFSEEGEYLPSDDEEDDADPSYGAIKTRRVSTSHAPTHSRTASNADKPARGPARRRRPVDDAAPSQCTYENPLNDERCPQIFARLPEMKRHIDHFHYEHEARAVIDGRLPRDLAKLLGPSWDGTLGKPTCEGCGTEFSRRDAVKRHQNEVKATFEDGRCVWCPGTQGRKGSAKRVAAAKLASGSPSKRQRRK